MVATTEESRFERPTGLLRGFKNFLLQGDIVIVAVGLVIALAFSTLIKAFTDNIISPLVNADGAGGSTGLGFHVNGQLVNIGAFIAAVIYFLISEREAAAPRAGQEKGNGRERMTRRGRARPAAMFPQCSLVRCG